jgi:hypothetical protein
VPAVRSMLPATATAAMPTAELKKYVKGVIAHVAIQTSYRLQHSGNFVVLERRPWVGDAGSSTISKYLEVLDSGLTAAEELAKARGAAAADVSTFLLMLLNDSTLDFALGGSGRLVYKRYDIVDYGPLASMNKAAISKALGANLLGGEAYEIKSDTPSEQQKGAAYVKSQTQRWNQSMSQYGSTAASVLKLPKGIDKYVLRPGASWPPTRQFIPLGKSKLEYWLAGPKYAGVISYKWTQFDPRSLKRMWQLYGETSKNVRRALKRDPSLRPATVAAGATAAVVVVVFAGLVVAGIAEAAAGGAVLEGLGAGAAEAGRQLIVAPQAMVLALRGALAGALALPSVAGAEPAGGTPPAMGPDAGQSEGSVAQLAFRYATEPNKTDELLFGGLPGGTAPTADEAFVKDVIDALVREILHRYGVQVGQGEEDLFNDEMLAILRENLTVVMSGLADEIGAAGMRELFGVDDAAENAADQVGAAVAQFAAALLDSSGGVRFFAELFDLTDDDFARMLPADYTDDGERPDDAPAP